MSLAELEDPFRRKALPHEGSDPMVFSMILLGITSSMTWAVLVLAVDDLQGLVPGMDGEYHLAAAYKTCMFVCGSFAVFAGWRLGLTLRVVGALIVQVVSLIGLELLCEVRPRYLYVLLVFLTMLGGAGQAVSQCALTGLCGMCPARYMRSFVVGLGASNLVAGILKLLAKAATGSLEATERVWLGSLVVLYIASIVCYLRVIHTNLTVRVALDMQRENEEAAKPLSGGSGTDSSSSRIWKVALEIWPWILLMVLNWAVTLCVFPGMTADLDSSSKAFQTSGWYHVLLVFTFVLFDVIGRQLTSFELLRDVSAFSLSVVTALRALFIPLFLVINRIDGPRRSHVIDVVAFVAVAVLALSNGLCVAVCYIRPAALVDSADKQNAGCLSFLSYSSGQLLGVFVALGMKVSGAVPE